MKTALKNRPEGIILTVFTGDYNKIRNNKSGIIENIVFPRKCQH